MRRGAAPAPRRISLPARLRRSRAATQRRAAGQRPAPRRSPPHRRSRARCPRPPARAGREPRRRSGCAASATAPSRPAPCRAANSACPPPVSPPPRHRRASRAPRRARRSLCAARSPAVPSRGARWQQPPPRAVAAHPPGRSPARQSAHTGKTPAERPPASRRTVPASARRYAGSTPPADRRRGGCLRQGTAHRPDAFPARRSARPRRAIPLSQTWFPSLPYPTTQQRTLPTLWESPLFPYR